MRDEDTKAIRIGRRPVEDRRIRREDIHIMVSSDSANGNCFVVFASTGIKTVKISSLVPLLLILPKIQLIIHSRGSNL